GPRLVKVGTGPTSVGLDIAAFRPTEFLEASLERCSAGLSFNIAFGIPHQQAHPPNPFRLHARRERPRTRCAAYKRDELASPHHPITSSARASTVAGTSIANDLAVLRLTRR